LVLARFYVQQLQFTPVLEVRRLLSHGACLRQPACYYGQYTSKLPETDEINIIVFQGSEFYLSGALRPNNNSRTDISKVTPLVTKEFKYLIAVDRLDQRISFPRERPYRAVTFIIHNQSKSVYNQYLLTEGKRFRSLFSAL
jgi:hypothetical protein